ncbi:MAG TPA: SCO family protein [Thermoanaerobaculia bacterium]|jgi:protein SCO1/2|nr:SCO family protein [Thermoanaerobaculia bacterium]
MRRSVLFLLLLAACHRASDLPHLFPVPAETLTRETGKPMNLAENKGYVTVYDFIFTNCAGTCPVMSANMRNLTRKIAKDAPVRFVSISVDPARDNPQQLRDYANHVRNDERWIFLTGQPGQITRLSVDGFKLAIGGTPQTAAEPLLHSSKFAIADKDGIIRAYEGGTDPDAVERVAGRVGELLGE